MKRAGIKAQVGYRSPQVRKGEASIVAPNRLQRQNTKTNIINGSEVSGLSVAIHFLSF